MQLLEKLQKLKGEEFEERENIDFSGMDNIVIYSDMGKINLLQAKLTKPMVYCFGYRPRTTTFELKISKRDEKTMSISVLGDGNLEGAEVNLTVLIPEHKFKCIEVSGIKTEININSDVETEKLIIKTEEGDVEALSNQVNNLYINIQKKGDIYLHLNEDVTDSMEAFTEKGEIEINFFNEEEGKNIKLVHKK